MLLLLGLLVVAGAVAAVARKVDVRLALGLAGLALGALAGQPLAVVRTFLQTLAREQFVVPICSAMGFAYVLRHTGCDRHLVRLLSAPLRRARPLLLPGAVLVGFLVNVPVVSQAGTAVTVGPVLLPLLRAAGVSPATAGAALLLGVSVGGELRNPGAPEFQTVCKALEERGRRATPQECSDRATIPLLLQLAVVTLAFWALSAYSERRSAAPVKAAEPARPDPPDPKPARSDLADALALPSGPAGADPDAGPEGPERIHALRAAVPLVPLVLLLLTGPPLKVLPVRQDWLVAAGEGPGARFDSRLIGAAMLVGVLAAALAAPRRAGGVGKAFFAGAGAAYAHIVALIVCAECFGSGVRLIGLADYLGGVLALHPALLEVGAVLIPMGFAMLCGSGFAATASVYGLFVPPALAHGVDPVAIGAVVSLAAAAGRTLSPVAAVVLLCGALTGASPFALIRRLVAPVLLGLGAVLLWRLFLN